MDERLSLGIELFNAGDFFRSHEVWEEIWKEERGPRRMFLQALIHVAVGLYHYEKGNSVGAVRQLRKGITKLAASLPASLGIDTGQLHRDAAMAAQSLEAGVRLTAYPRIHFLPSANKGS